MNTLHHGYSLVLIPQVADSEDLQIYGKALLFLFVCHFSLNVRNPIIRVNTSPPES